MSTTLKIYTGFTLVLLFATLAIGLVASWAFLYPETYNAYVPFYQLRPIHVSLALFWIISGASACVIYFKKEAFSLRSWSRMEYTFMYVWMITIVTILIFYGFRKFGGREYWEFPPLLSIPLLAAWLLLMVSYFTDWKRTPKKQPLYVWMWSTGILFFLITFLEQNFWHIPWFRQSFLREITVQWKSNGSMVGAWNQMIYGTALFLMVKISREPAIAQSKKAFAFYFLGLTNLMFNWGHHIYNVPSAGWIRHVSYAVSMTEWLIFISIVQGFRQKLDERSKLRHLIPYKFIIASEFWVFMNLLLALFMSVPAINRYTHGTHITVAHAMGATIGINSMILLAAFSYMLNIHTIKEEVKKRFIKYYWLSQGSLMLFWLSLIGAGIVKGYRHTALNIEPFQEMMRPVMSVLKVFSYSGIGLLIGLGGITCILLKQLKQEKVGDISKPSKLYLWKQESR